MPQLIRRATAPQVSIDASTVDLVDESLVAEFEPDWSHNGLLDVHPDGGAAKILCGQEVGCIAVTAELWDGAPPLDPGPWQDVAEMSVHWPSALLDFGTTTEGAEETGSTALTLPGPGDYRVRVCGRNRDDGDPREDDAPVEEYLIQLWPAPTTGPEIHKATSKYGTLWTQ
ncbi:hypothetical protein [Streptomyces sp. MST-110588]|uniref:hypothetical protein n=1 Tax=Streptomyces sp. MST-110588 TaxID=2833628 RepID=UPI001F5E173B|nr:hypothetical protein [Streptomyces sp. MST-110588]UNO43554.1 hypothetical protein KGS77_33860 [Streptomyces sp. MST-110588]